MTTHKAVIAWSLGDAVADAEYLAGRYSRIHTIGLGAGVSLPGSASPSLVRAPWSTAAAADPEALLVASAAACHMLWFLDFAKQAGLVVRRYGDAPFGTMGAMADGSVGMVRITLRPAIGFGGKAPPQDLFNALHHKAHAACYIANSLKSEVVIEPEASARSGPPDLID